MNNIYYVLAGIVGFSLVIILIEWVSNGNLKLKGINIPVLLFTIFIIVRIATLITEDKDSKDHQNSVVKILESKNKLTK
jgi:hypothetical protein